MNKKIYCDIGVSTDNCLIITFYHKIGNNFIANNGIICGNINKNLFVCDFIEDHSMSSHVEEYSLKEIFDYVFKRIK